MSHDDLKCTCGHTIINHEEPVPFNTGNIEPLGFLVCMVGGCPCQKFEEDVGE